MNSHRRSYRGLLLLTVLLSYIHTCIGFVVPALRPLFIKTRHIGARYAQSQNQQEINNIESIKYATPANSCKIKVLGVGGGGGNAVNRILNSKEALPGVQFWAANTDAQALAGSLAPHKLNIGKISSRGLGAGGSPEVGRRAAEENREDILEAVRGADLVFITAGMGGGTGSGAAPVLAECAKESGALTVGVVTKPFAFEGRKRMLQAQESILELKKKVDTLIVVSNDKLLKVVPPGTSLCDAFLLADEILQQGVVGISDIILKPGMINVDFADVRTIMANAGTSLIGIGKGVGPNRAVDAAAAALDSPLLDYPIARAKGIIFNVVGGSDMTLQEVNQAADAIYDRTETDASIIFGAQIDDSITTGEMQVTIVASGFPTDYFLGDEEFETAEFFSDGSRSSSRSRFGGDQIQLGSVKKWSSKLYSSVNSVFKPTTNLPQVE